MHTILGQKKKKKKKEKEKDSITLASKIYEKHFF